MRRIRLLLTMPFVTAALLGGTVPTAFAAQASTADVTVTVLPGALSLSGVSVTDFDAVTLDGTATMTPARLSDFAVSDFRGSGAGWHVTVHATQFAESHDDVGYLVGGARLAQGSLLMPAPQVSTVGDTSSPAPIVRPGPHAIDGAAAVTVASAAVGTGMGEYLFSTGELALSLPSDVRATTYRSTVTVDLVSGP